MTLRALVTGAGGFLGSHLTRELVAQGDEVHVLLRAPDAAWRLADVQSRLGVCRGDLFDGASLRAAIATARPHVLFHLAGDTRGRSDEDHDPRPLFETNVVGTFNLLSAVVEACPTPPLIVRTGTLLEYGNAPAPFHEATPEVPSSSYAATQLTATTLARAVASAERLRLITVRLGLCYGPARGLGSFIPDLAFRAAVGGVFDVRSPDQLRAPLYVTDAVGVLLAAARWGINAARAPELFNACGAEVLTLEAIVARAARLAGEGLTVRHLAAPRARGAVSACYCDNARARQRLGWSPLVGLDAGLRATLEWYRSALPKLSPEHLR